MSKEIHKKSIISFYRGLMDRADYSRLPEHMKLVAREWIEYGVYPGGFLINILKNDFLAAARKADDINQALFFEWARWLDNIPCGAWGENIYEWREIGGLNGKMQKDLEALDAEFETPALEIQPMQRLEGDEA